MSVKVGDRVKVGRGHVEYVVEWTHGNSARIRSARRSLMTKVDRLTVVQPAPAQVEPSIVYEESGTIRVDGRVLRGGDSWTEVVVDWGAAAHVSQSYDDQPSAVSVYVSSNAQGVQTIGVESSGPVEERETVAFLTRQSAIDLAGKILTLAARMT